MTIHICSEKLLAIEADAFELPNDESVRRTVGKVLRENGIDDWKSMEISQFSECGKCLVMAVPVRVYIPGIMAALADDNS